jgi:hypothetical protein
MEMKAAASRSSSTRWPSASVAVCRTQSRNSGALNGSVNDNSFFALHITSLHIFDAALGGKESYGEKEAEKE